MDTSTPPADSQVPDSAAPGRSKAVAASSCRPRSARSSARPGPRSRSPGRPAWSSTGAPIAAAYLMLQLLTMILASFNVLIGEPEITPVLEFVQFLAKFLVPAWLWIGQTLAFLRIARREPFTIEELFPAVPWLLTLLLATGILLAIAAIPCLLIYGTTEAFVALRGGDALASIIRDLLPEGGPDILTSLLTGWLALLAISMVVAALSYIAFFAVTVRLGQFPYLIIDRGTGVLESLRMSMRLTDGRAWTVFLIYLRSSRSTSRACWPSTSASCSPCR